MTNQVTNCSFVVVKYVSQSQSYIRTDSQSVSMSWCRAQSGTFDQRSFFFVFLKLLSCHLGAPSLTRGRICPLSIQSKIVSVFTYKIYNDIYIICVRHSSVIYNIYKL
jgi:hypothetical protein